MRNEKTIDEVGTEYNESISGQRINFYGSRDWAMFRIKEALQRLSDISCLDRFTRAESDVEELNSLGYEWYSNRLGEAIKRYKSQGNVRTLAYTIKKELEPFCIQVAVAGSIRRKCERPNSDIDIVYAPKGDKEYSELLKYMSKYRVYFEGQSRELYGESICGIKMDLSCCEITNFGPMLLKRTGSREFNIYCNELAMKKGWLLNEYGLWGDRQCAKLISSGSETEIFDLLGIGWVPPTERNRDT